MTSIADLLSLGDAQGQDTRGHSKAVLPNLDFPRLSGLPGPLWLPGFSGRGAGSPSTAKATCEHRVGEGVKQNGHAVCYKNKNTKGKNGTPLLSHH